MESLQPDLAQVKRHVLVLDQDGLGKRLEREMVRRFTTAKRAVTANPM
ncbi:MAG: hypothetical protein HQL74_15870 [Magnetococcales bacterium]|nr:hypothetical protein [Magnetococcales bacterium]